MVIHWLILLSSIIIMKEKAMGRPSESGQIASVIAGGLLLTLLGA